MILYPLSCDPLVTYCTAKQYPFFELELLQKLPKINDDIRNCLKIIQKTRRESRQEGLCGSG